MRVIFFKKIPLFILAAAVIFGVTIGIPAVSVIKKISTETRDYWEGSKDIIWHVNTKEKMIALTFDDGPSPTFTPEVLDILKKSNAHGTFFVIAHEVEKYPDIVRRLVYEGNEVANHTYNHKYLNRISKEDLRAELNLAESIIIKASGLKPKLFRPPGGYYNKDIVEVSKEQGYKVFILQEFSSGFIPAILRSEPGMVLLRIGRLIIRIWSRIIIKLNMKSRFPALKSFRGANSMGLIHIPNGNPSAQMPRFFGAAVRHWV